MEHAEIAPKKQGFWSLARRGALRRCPSCGKGRLFKRYISQVDACKACGEALGHIRADDGPAWLTILLVGHIIAPLFTYYALATTWPEWVAIAVLGTATLMLTLAILPSAKGVFIAAIWRSGCEGARK